MLAVPPFQWLGVLAATLYRQAFGQLKDEFDRLAMVDGMPHSVFSSLRCRDARLWGIRPQGVLLQVDLHDRFGVSNTESSQRSRACSDTICEVAPSDDRLAAI